MKSQSSNLLHLINTFKNCSQYYTLVSIVILLGIFVNYSFSIDIFPNNKSINNPIPNYSYYILYGVSCLIVTRIIYLYYSFILTWGQIINSEIYDNDDHVEVFNLVKLNIEKHINCFERYILLITFSILILIRQCPFESNIYSHLHYSTLYTPLTVISILIFIICLEWPTFKIRSLYNSTFKSINYTSQSMKFGS